MSKQKQSKSAPAAAVPAPTEPVYRVAVEGRPVAEDLRLRSLVMLTQHQAQLEQAMKFLAHDLKVVEAEIRHLRSVGPLK